jgi:Alpha/beta hydrolase
MLLQQCLAWDAPGLSTAALRLRRQASQLSDVGRALGRVLAGTAAPIWAGPAATAAAERCHDLTRHVTAVASETLALATALARVAEDVEAAQRQSAVNVEHSAAAARDADERAAQAAGAFLSAVGPVASELATLWSWLSRSPATSVSAFNPAFDPAFDPAMTAAWWAGLPAVVQHRLLQTSPQLLGDLTGLPVEVRDTANRAVLAAELTRIRREIALLQLDRPTNVSRYLWTQGGPRAVAARRAALEQRLDVLEHVAAAVAKHDRYLLTLDQRLPGRTVVAVGNPDTARHVAVLVPGMNTSVRDDLSRFVNSAARLREAAARRTTRDSDVAVVAWLGYVTPMPLTVLSDRSAQRAVPELRKTVAGLHAAPRAAGRDVHLTVVGHSYGSLVAGLAARAPSHVDDLVLMGSPGVGAYHARELAVRRVFVLEAAGDGIADVGHFGRDPSSRRFGAEPLAANEAADGSVATPARGHSSYLNSGTASLRNLAAVVVDQPTSR